MKRSTRVATAAHTLAVIDQGAYTNPSGLPVEVSAAVAAAVAGTRTIRPDEWEPIVTADYPTDGFGRIEVTGETTLAAARRLVVVERVGDVAALNFASARNAGGGFKNGSQAQEESLARSSALYASLVAAPAYYEANRTADNLYTDHAILSPAIPVFRDDDGDLLDAPYPVTFVTMPAPNLNAMPPGSPLRPSVPTTLVRRARCVLALSLVARCRTVVLGAWGCGVFGNDPAVVADAFAYWLADGQPWRRRFDRLVFAIYDGTRDRGVAATFASRLGVTAGCDFC